MNPLFDVREPIQQLSLQAYGFLDCLNATLLLGSEDEELSEAEKEIIAGNLPPLAAAMRMIYVAVMGEPMPDAMPENPRTALFLEPGGRVLNLLFAEEAGTEVFRDVLGADLEMILIPHEGPLACFVDANAIEKDLEENGRAARLFSGMESSPKILGPVIICGWDFGRDAPDDCPEEIFELLRES